MSAPISGRWRPRGGLIADFVSYNPKMPRGLRIQVRRVERDPRAIADLEREVTEFLAEVEQQLEAA